MVDSRFGKPSRFVHLSNVQCSGEESKLADCTDSFSQQDSTTIVDHIDVAGVICINPSKQCLIGNCYADNSCKLYIYVVHNGGAILLRERICSAVSKFTLFSRALHITQVNKPAWFTKSRIYHSFRSCTYRR